MNASARKRASLTKADEAFLVFVIEYVPGAAERAGSKEYASTQPRKDWQAELSDDEFRVFNLLRDERSKMAEAEGVKVFNIFTNAQLAAMVKCKVGDAMGLAKIPQVGEGRLKKYGERILTVLASEYGSVFAANGLSEQGKEGVATP